MAAPARGQRTGRALATSNRIPGHRRWWALAAVLLAQFTTALTATIVSTAAPTIADELHGIDLYGWIFTAYMLTSALAIPVVGALSDIYGRRLFYALGMSCFLLGTALCGLSQSMPELIGARLLAGVGGGVCLSLAATTVGDIFSPLERARWQVLITSFWGAGNILGPVLGGFVTDHLGWRWVFNLSLLPGILALVLLLAFLPRVRTLGDARVDVAGILLLAAGVVPLLLALSWGGVDVAWSTPWLIGLLAIGVAMLVGLIIHELHTPVPIVNPALFRLPVYTLTVLMSLLTGTILYAGIAFLPTYGQAVLGASAQESGLLLLPLIIGFMVGSAGTGQVVSRTGRYRLNLIVGVLLTLAGEGCVLAAGDQARLQVMAGSALLGLGVGASFPLTNVVAQGVHPYRLLGAVNGTRQFFVNITAVLTISIMSTVLVNTLTRSLSDSLDPRARRLIGPLGGNSAGGLLSSRGRAALADRLAALPDGTGRSALETVHQGLTAGLQHVFEISVVISLAALAVSLCVPEIPLRSTFEEVTVAPDAAPPRSLSM